MPEVRSGERFGASSPREVYVATEDYARAIEILKGKGG
jgi:hypothetical protein